MTRPGVEVISRAQPLPRSAPTDTGVAFMLGATLSGVDVKLVRSLSEYESEFGIRTGYEPAYDAADAYFREGGAKLTVSRTNGTAVTLSAEGPLVDDGLSGRSRSELDEIARERGIDDPESLPNREAVVEAIRQTLSESDERASRYDIALQVVDPGIASALARLTKDYGPGQIFATGTLAANVDTQTALLAHAEATNRIALLNAADGTAASLITAAAALRSLATARYGALFAPSAVVPGIAGGTTRTVPYNTIEAGIIARNDVIFNPNVPAAGVNGQAVFASDLVQRYTDSEYEQLNEGGVDAARLIYDGVRTYGYRTLVDPAGTLQAWLDLGNARLNMAIVARAEAIGERYVFAPLDGRFRTIAQFGGDLRAMLVPYWEQGALYGETADDAFWVDVSEQVNTPTTIANGELHAVLSVRMSPFAELVVIEIVKIATTQALAA